jgi:Tfp pilus assembly protein PilF/predicted Ser/Thr protein kinase
MDKKTIAGYTIEEALGEGGMGVVYRAVDPTLDRRLAVKVIRRTNLSAAAKERFIREARAASRLNHPHIVTVYAAGEEDGHPYLAMEYVEGPTLRAIIDEGPIPWDKATEWTCDILDALDKLHHEGIVHRDLKPENIMVTPEGVVKLMDFGIAHMAESETLTQEGATVGTVYYMSPEQAAAKKTDARSDIFSIAAVLYQMVTGEHPFPGEHPMAVMYSITNLPPKTLAAHPVKVPDGLQAVLDKAMEKNRDDRYPDAAAFRDALRKLRERELGLAPAPSLKTRLLQIGVPVLVVIVLAVVAFVLFGRGGEPKPNRDVAKQHNELGQSAQEDGDVATARDEYRRAIVADPGYMIPWNNLGMLAEQEGNFEEADSLYRKAVSIDSSYAAALHNLASLRWDRGDLGSAEKYFRASLRADSTLFAGYNNLGALLLEAKRPAEAGEVLDKGLSFHPDQPYLLKNRGLVAQELGEDDAAIDYWKRGIEKDSTIVELHRLSAEWYERHGRVSEARVHWEIVASSPNEQERGLGTDALERLRSH